MRGDERTQDGMFSYVSLEERVRQDHPLRAVRSWYEERSCRAHVRDHDRIRDLPGLHDLFHSPVYSAAVQPKWHLFSFARFDCRGCDSTGPYATQGNRRIARWRSRTGRAWLVAETIQQDVTGHRYS